MSGPASRRGFLSGLVSLPLIGGAVTLIGSPVAAAEPISRALIDSYDAWLFYERRRLKAEKIGPAMDWDTPGHEDAFKVAWDFVPVANGGFRYSTSRNGIAAPPSTRAALVLSAVGCDWREGGR
jgi:hypothetical protein